MCSNYRPTSDKALLQRHFGATVSAESSWPAEAWPMSQTPAIRRPASADETVDTPEVFVGQFGLMPFWAKDPTLARRTYNARSETAAQKPSYRDAWRRGHRCIIPAQCIYEPRYDSGKAVRWQIGRADGAPMGIAGLWSLGWSHNGAPVPSFTMLTVNADAHPLMSRFHKPEEEKRMVVVLDEADYERWLDCPVEQMMDMMRPCPAEWLRAEAAPLAARQATPA